MVELMPDKRHFTNLSGIRITYIYEYLIIHNKEERMLASLLILADVITIRIGDNVWTIGPDLIVYLIVAAIVGFVAESIVGWRLPFGIVGAIIAALIGIWLMTHVFIITGIGDISIAGIPIIRALIGAIILVGLWYLLTYRTWYRRRRYYYRRY
jgi:uncharacterized membrane protein YeaQ/YmgE (transglycosylase-associated protein family)